MLLSSEQRDGIGVALNESDLLGLEVDPERRIAAATFRVLTLPEEGPMPDDRRVQVLFEPVGRVEAALREGAWDDPSAPVVPFGIEELLKTVQSFDGLPIYGWKFIDVQNEYDRDWTKHLSLDWSSGTDGLSHSITVFQDAGNRILDVRLWFDDLRVFEPGGVEIPLDSFIAGGRRWWDALFEGDERARGFGPVPM